MTTFPHIRAALTSEVWAIEPGRFNDILAVIERRIVGERLSKQVAESIRGERDRTIVNGMAAFYEVSAGALIEARGSRAPDEGASPNLIAVISIFGIIAQHASQVDDISGPGGTSTERVGASFRAAMADPSVKAIVLNINSPGGTVHGVQALADEIQAARGRGKPIVTQANSVAASAAYWIGCAADEVVITPGGEVGSIGAYTVHEDLSKAAEMKGLKVSVIAAGKYKAEGQPFEPLADDTRTELQRRVDGVHTEFVASVAKGRQVPVDTVRSDYGQGRMLSARDAVKIGMADRVGTLNDTLNRLAKAKASTGARAEQVDSILASSGVASTVEPATTVDDEAVRAEHAAALALAEAEQQEVERVRAEAARATAESDAHRRRRHAARLRQAV